MGLAATGDAQQHFEESLRQRLLQEVTLLHNHDRSHPCVASDMYATDDARACPPRCPYPAHPPSATLRSK